MNDQQITEVAQYAMNNNFATNQDIIDHLSSQDLPDISRNTVTNYLKRKGISSKIASQKPALSPESKNIRVEAALSNLLVPLTVFRRTVFIDEFSVDSRMKRKKRVKRLKGQRYSDDNLDVYELRNPKTVSFCCCFSYDGVGPIRLTEGRFNADKYLAFLREEILPYYRAVHDDNFFLLQDNSPVHKAGIVMDFLRDEMPNRVHLHPPYSPDLNPIENLGNMLKKKIGEKLKTLNHRNHREIGEISVETWREFNTDIEFLHSLVDSMRRRYSQCINVMGNPTSY